MFYTPVNAVALHHGHVHNSTSIYQIRTHALEEWVSTLDVLFGSEYPN